MVQMRMDVEANAVTHSLENNRVKRNDLLRMPDAVIL